MLTRTDWLAKPNKRRITPKYIPPPPKKWKKIPHPVITMDNDRINKLSVPRYRVSKWTVPKRPLTSVPKSALGVALSPRLDHLSRPNAM